MDDKAISVIVTNGETALDLSAYIAGSIQWSGKIGSAARSLTGVFLDYLDPPPSVALTALDGQELILMEGDRELFRGMIMKYSRTEKFKITVTAYDKGIYLSNNKASFNYANMTLDQVVAAVCGNFGIPTGALAQSGYIIPSITKSKTTAWDVICEALEQTYDMTGMRYYVSDIGGKICLTERRAQLLEWVIEPYANLESYTYSASVEKRRTRINVYSKEDTVIATAADPYWESRIGVLADCMSAEDDLNEAQLYEKAQKALSLNILPEYNFSVRARGISEVITGGRVTVYLDHFNFAAAYYVDGDTHTWDMGEHTMSLELTQAAYLVPINGE